LHSLDLTYHKTSSKNTVFAINRALRSIESGLRFSLGFFTPVAIEFLLLCGMMGFYCGPKYLANMLITLSLYTAFTKQVSNYRRQEMQNKKEAEKKSEFYLNESIMNYETVKAFNNEALEKKRYQSHLDSLFDCAMKVQKSLSKLNQGQNVIFTTGSILNLVMALTDVSKGIMTPGDFIMINAYFMQLSGPLFNMGTLFREVQQT
jgi:ATP-binding cassette, subfamily B, heavy metal transporter